MPTLHENRPRRRWLLTPAVALVALSATFLVACNDTSETVSPRVDTSDAAAETDNEAATDADSDEAEPTEEPSPEDLGDEVAAVAPVDGGYAFNELASDGVTPVSYDACLPIRYVTRIDGAPADGARLIAEALDMVSVATGLEFIDEGVTDEGPSGEDGRELYQDRYDPDELVPVLIVWSDANEAPELSSGDSSEDETLAYASSDAVYATDDESDTAPMVYATGEVVLDTPDLRFELEDEEGGGYDYVRAVIAHELGHLVGLDHVDQPDELMQPYIDDLRGFGPGDLEGLAMLGQGECYE